MKKPNFTKLVRTLQKNVGKHSPDILMGVGIAGMITATVLAVKATPKALQLIEEEKERTGKDELTVVDTVKVAWKPYISTAVTLVSSTGCLIGARNITSRRTAALATAYKISETALSEYKEKVVEVLGEKKNQEVKDRIAKDRIERNPVSKTKEIIITEKGNTLCYDSLSGRYFKSDINTIKEAVNKVNKDMLCDMYVSLNAFYYELGLENIDLGNRLGWNVNGKLLEIDFSSILSDDGRPCLVLDYLIEPQYDYDKFM